MNLVPGNRTERSARDVRRVWKRSNWRRRPRAASVDVARIALRHSNLTSGTCVRHVYELSSCKPHRTQRLGCARVRKRSNWQRHPRAASADGARIALRHRNLTSALARDTYMNLIPAKRTERSCYDVRMLGSAQTGGAALALASVDGARIALRHRNLMSGTCARHVYELSSCKPHRTQRLWMCVEFGSAQTGGVALALRVAMVRALLCGTAI